MIEHVDITSAAHKADPFPYYGRLRAESPVHEVLLPGKQKAWLITRYDDVVAALKDERLVKDPRTAWTAEQAAKAPWVPAVFKPLERNMLDLDGADHARLRSLVHMAFTPRIVERMRERIQSLSEELLSQAIARGRFDLIADYALPIPTTIIAEMLGVPAGDRLRFHRWSATVVSADRSQVGMLRVIPRLWLFLRYVRTLIAARRAAPGDDLLSALVQAEAEGAKLNDDELVAMVFVLLIAGHETTVNLIGNGALALLTHPDQMARLRADPGIIKPAVEELLRFTSPVMTATERYAREDMALHGVTIPRGSLVLAVLASANRDPDPFPDPDTLDLTRDPNRHVAFGFGAHYCVGAPLARLEGQIAIRTLVERAPTLRLAVDDGAVRWRKGMVLRGVTALPVAVGR
ncbi:MAG: cytochrome P450 [Ardenticatenales bacterium]